MTPTDESMGDSSRDEILAGEYVLGVLSASDRRVIEARIRRDKPFAEMVSRWENDLSDFNASYQDATPSRQTFQQIETRLFGTPESGRPALWRFWNSVVLWRALTALSTAVALGAVVVASGVIPRRLDAPLVADLAAADGGIDLRAIYDRQDGRMHIVPVAAGSADKKSLELWIVPAGGSPISLGVFSADAAGDLIVPAVMRDRIADGATLAVTLETFGGSPTGLPIGPVVASGKTRGS